MKILAILLFAGLALMPAVGEAKPEPSAHGASECARFYVAVAQGDVVPSTFVGQKVRFACPPAG